MINYCIAYFRDGDVIIKDSCESKYIVVITEVSILYN